MGILTGWLVECWSPYFGQSHYFDHFAIRLPTPALYIYIKDRYVVVSKRLLLTVTLLAVLILLLIVTVRRMR